MLKKLLDKLRFELWKTNVMALLKSTSPMVEYPMLAWLDLEAPKIVQEKGFDAMLEASQAKLEEINNAWTIPLDFPMPESIPPGEFTPGQRMKMLNKGNPVEVTAIGKNAVKLDNGVIIKDFDEFNVFYKI